MRRRRAFGQRAVSGRLPSRPPPRPPFRPFCRGQSIADFSSGNRRIDAILGSIPPPNPPLLACLHLAYGGTRHHHHKHASVGTRMRREGQRIKIMRVRQGMYRMWCTLAGKTRVRGKARRLAKRYGMRRAGAAARGENSDSADRPGTGGCAGSKRALEQ